ncbi:hypothetical protein ACFOUP_09995 [Belliella kenyensis]|uniref:Uncharacterized protein n=1 Tax=Belliella kenyensis TaxID=1472724 RepID=A0ABV8EK77_9BACT|nr:hypothetical protein [Belliella kenyensis]MCH7403042.1 hypothetical protein [Belliella kenyensis]MDN3605079.1 hypothetical protein [Belliella kenyensis]
MAYRMVEVFATNITNIKEAKAFEGFIMKRFPTYRVNFDLEDCDHILRIENQMEIDSSIVEEIAHAMNIHIKVLEDI